MPHLTHKQIRILRRQQRQQQERRYPKEPETEDEILDRIHEIEYQRIKLPKILHPQIPIIQVNIADEIKRLYGKLDALKAIREKQEKEKPDVPST